MQKIFFPIFILAACLAGCSGDNESKNEVQTFTEELMSQYPNFHSNDKAKEAISEAIKDKAETLIDQPATFFKGAKFSFLKMEELEGVTYALFECQEYCEIEAPTYASTKSSPERTYGIRNVESLGALRGKSKMTLDLRTPLDLRASFRPRWKSSPKMKLRPGNGDKKEHIITHACAQVLGKVDDATASKFDKPVRFYISGTIDGWQASPITGVGGLCVLPGVSEYGIFLGVFSIKDMTVEEAPAK